MKKVIIGFVAFLGFMVICTLISKSVYAYRLPMVSTCVPESKYIEHKVEAQGIVEAGGEKTVTYLAGLRIDSVLVHVGDRVEEGDALFQVDLEDLKELMEEKKNEMSKVSLQINAILENQAIEQQKREVELARQGKIMIPHRACRIPRWDGLWKAMFRQKMIWKKTEERKL